MASTSETGHHKNVSSFESLVSSAQGLGANYNPSKISLKLPALQTQLASVKVNITSVTNTTVAWS